MAEGQPALRRQPRVASCSITVVRSFAANNGALTAFMVRRKQRQGPCLFRALRAGLRI
jgi:hypothetical protein